MVRTLVTVFCSFLVAAEALGAKLEPTLPVDLADGASSSPVKQQVHVRREKPSDASPKQTFILDASGDVKKPKSANSDRWINGWNRSSVACSEMWHGESVSGADENHQCDAIPLSPHWTWGGAAPPIMCVRPYSDFVSDIVRQQKRWPDCAALSFLWTKLPSSVVESNCSSFAPCGGEGVRKVFVDVGANIGACTMQMLSRPDVAQVVSFEPNPKNLFYLTGGVLENPGYTSKLALFPMALGKSDGSHKMFMTPGNAGNTVLDNAVAANPISDVQPTKVKTITLDEVFLEKGRPPYIHLMKVDAQGFEVNILKGGRQLLASGAINAIHFELAPAWLQGEGTSAGELFTILENSGYNIYHSIEDITENAELPAPLSHSDLVKIACKENGVPPRDFFAIRDYSIKAGRVSQAITCALTVGQ